MRLLTTIIFTLQFFVLTFAQGPCAGGQPAGNTCAQATPICDLNGYCGNTSASYSVNSWSSLSSQFCGSIENNSFIKFTASASTVSLSVWVGNCTSGSGIQIMVFSSAGACSGNVTKYYCNGQFSPSPNAQSLTVNGLTPGVTYFLMIDGFAGDVCDYSFTANSGVSLPVTVTPTTTTLCLGQTVTLTAAGGSGTYNWNPSPDLSSTTTGTVTVTPPSVVGTYTYTVNSATNNTNCTATTATATVEVENCACSSLTTTGNGPLCPGDLIDLQATIGSGVVTNPSWTGPNGFTSTALSPAGFASPATPGSYTYTFSCDIDGTNCTSDVTIIVDPCPNGCNINNIRSTFTAAGCIELQACVDNCSVYYLNPQSMTGSQAQAFAQNLGANLVSIQSLAENNCILTALNTLGQTGTIWIGLNDEQVEGTFVWYDQSPVSYTNWAPGEPNNSGNEDCVQIYPGGSNPGTWNDLSCNSANSKSIIEVNLCPVVRTGPDITICDGETAVIQSNATILGSQPYTYNWSNGPTVYPNSVTPNVTTEYILTSSDRYGCTGKDTMKVIVNPLPVVEAGPDLTICSGEDVILNGTGGAGTWNNGVTNGVVFNPTVSGKYKYTVTSNGCTVVDSLYITVKPSPLISILPDKFLGCSPFEVNFKNLAVQPGVIYSWDFGDGTSFNALGDTVHTFIGGGCYDVTFTANLNGCIEDTTYEDLICIDDNPVASFIPQPASLSVMDPETVFSNNSTYATSYIWTFGDGEGSTSHSPSHTYPDADGGSYLVTLIAISDLGCRDTATIIVEVADEIIYYVPNAFTPDEDEFNPTFKPIFTNGFDPSDYHMYIYTRWGELIFQSNDVSFGWDGTYTGSDGRVMDGSYTWRIEFKTKVSDARKIIMGSVTIIK